MAGKFTAAGDSGESRERFIVCHLCHFFLFAIIINIINIIVCHFFLVATIINITIIIWLNLLNGLNSKLFLVCYSLLKSELHWQDLFRDSPLDHMWLAQRRAKILYLAGVGHIWAHI